eukprot:3138016-Amphidinium_carterae.1
MCSSRWSKLGEPAVVNVAGAAGPAEANVYADRQGDGGREVQRAHADHGCLTKKHRSRWTYRRLCTEPEHRLKLIMESGGTPALTGLGKTVMNKRT